MARVCVTVSVMGSLASWRLRRLADSPGDLAVRAGGWLLFWAAALFVARDFAGRIEYLPVIAVVPAALLAVTVVSARFPRPVLFVAAMLTGMYGTAEAEFGLKAYAVIHVLLLGLWLATLRGLVTRRRDLRPQLWLGPFLILLLAGGALAWVLLNELPSAAFGQWRIVYWIMLGALLVAYAPFESMSSRSIMQVLLLAGGVISGYALLRWRIGASANEREYALTVAGQFT